jgi:predicted RecB family nuclease
MDSSRDFIVPEFDIEIDIDLENSQEAIREAGLEDSIGRDAVYLYGFGVHERYKNPDWMTSSFGYFDDYADTDEAEFNVLSQMWQFLQEQVKIAEAQGKSVGIFHYSTHERTWWRNFTERHASKPGSPTRQSVEDFMAKYFVDLLPLAKELAFPATGYSIKALAPFAGFNWRVDDAGGGNSIVYYQTATSRENTELDRSTAIGWLRSYNEDDVRATMAVRQYLRSLTL